MEMTSPAGDEAPHTARIAENVRAIYELDEHCRSAEPPHQQRLNRFARRLGGHVSLAVVMVGAAGWMLVNLLLGRAGMAVLDRPPFFWLQGALALTSLLTTLLVLTRQEQQRRFDERRAHLDLQVNLVSEQKVAKLIALVEELRRDMPNVPNRHDAEASNMAAPTDPVDVLAGLEPTLDLDAYRRR